MLNMQNKSQHSQELFVNPPWATKSLVQPAASETVETFRFFHYFPAVRHWHPCENEGVVLYGLRGRDVKLQ